MVSLTDPKFTHWYPYFAKTLKEVSNEACNETLAAYMPMAHISDTPTCYAHLDCVLDNLRESTKEHMASSTVVLGLTPIILASFAPNIGEIALISARRPLMAFLLAAASVTIASPRLINPITSGAISESLSASHSRPTHTTPPSHYSWYDTPRARRYLALLQYPALLGAIANALLNSYALGQRSVLAWKCNISIFPLLWTLLPPLIFLLIFLPFRYSRLSLAIRRSPHTPWLSREFRISAPLDPRALEEALELGGWMSWVMRLGVVAGIVHGLVGAVVFSSLAFVGALDALVVVVRYGVSAVVCYAVFTFELYCMQPDGAERGGDQEEGMELVGREGDGEGKGEGR